MNKKEKIKLFLQLCNKLGDEAKIAFDQLLTGVGESLGINDPTFIQFKNYMVDHYEDIHKEFVAAKIESYDKHLSEEAIDAAIAYHSTQYGMEVIEKMDIINKELVIAGAKLSERIAREFQEKLEGMNPEYSFQHDPPEDEIPEDDDDDLDEFKKQYGLD